MTWLKQNWFKVGLSLLVLVIFFVIKEKDNILNTATINDIIKLPISKDCSELTPENPYPEGTGGYAGFDWSKLDRGSGDCEAYSEPFIIGCMEYIRQMISYNQCENNQAVIAEYKAIKPVLLTCKEGETVGGYCLSD